MKTLNFKYLILFFGSLLFLNQNGYSQKVIFGKHQDLVNLKKGDIVEIKADTAYVISRRRAKVLNEKIDELEEVKVLYNGLAGQYNGLNVELEKVQSSLSEVVSKMESDSLQLSDHFVEIIGDLDQSIENLKSNNKSLKTNNSKMRDEISKLHKVIKAMKKETRRIWWDGLTDKIVAFAGGAGIGLLIGVLLL
ncbi:hypothetical protein [Reichenbachiella versicolor]|uniref:hypothetical protein n=1 Tax=Reichenbachiella versicolor TaxID=1821036 RepID=UPI000D6E4D16|nr:hypothetical protein [Reichenbachiella versicolor]